VDGSFAFFLLICVLFGIAGGLQGRSKGSSFVLWFFISACLPLFGFLASVVYPGSRHEQRRRCDGCGRLLPITDTMCMGCGTDLAFPEVRYASAARGPAVPQAGPDGPPAGGDEEANPYEQAALAADAPAAAGASPDRP
jgi:hypothetical protein